MKALAIFALFLYFPYGWCALVRAPREEFGLIWKAGGEALSDVALVSVLTLLPLTVVSLYFFGSALPEPGLHAVFSSIFSGLAAAVAEETFFRGWMQTLLRKKLSRFGAIFTASALFGLAHLASPYAPFALLAFFPGLIMGFLRERHGSVFPAILYHWAGNIWSVWFYPRF